MSEETVYVDSSCIANTCLELIYAHRDREYNFLSKLSDFAADRHYYVKHGDVLSVTISLSKKKIEEVLRSAGIPYSKFYTKGHFSRRTVFVTF